MNPKNKERIEFERSDAFQQRLEIRRRIEDKNGEMKVAHGLRRADFTGLEAMRLQTYFTAFAVNAKRIVTSMEAKPDNDGDNAIFWLYCRRMLPV